LFAAALHAVYIRGMGVRTCLSVVAAAGGCLASRARPSIDDLFHKY
jgi:hypothetical protein